MYIWQRPGWPDLRQDYARLAAPLGRARHAEGRLRGRMEALGPGLRGEAVLLTLTEDAVASSGIEATASTPAGSARRSRTASAWMRAARRRPIRQPTASSG